MNWHQLAAGRMAVRTRDMKAHVRSEAWSTTGKAMCGVTWFLVEVEERYARNKKNNVCPACLAALDRRAARQQKIDAEWREFMASPPELGCVDWSDGTGAAVKPMQQKGEST